MIVYGSYLKRDIDILSSAKNTVVFDTLAAITAGLVIIPAVFAYGFDPMAGPPLLFITIPTIFQQMPLGRIFAIFFFSAVLFAAISSLINLYDFKLLRIVHPNTEDNPRIILDNKYITAI